MSDFAELPKLTKQLKQSDPSLSSELPQDAFPLHKRKEALLKGRSKVAYFSIDPLCHEMAKEFFSDLQKAGANLQKPTVSLSTAPKARFAELPNFKPIKSHKEPSTPSWPLFPPEKEFQRLQKELKTMTTCESMGRSSIQAIRGDSAPYPHHRVEILNLKEICEQTLDSLEQRCVDADLIVVEAKELNEAEQVKTVGETKVSLIAFGRWIKQIQTAWDRLHTLGVQEFVFITGNAGQSVADEESKETVQESSGPQPVTQTSPGLTTPQERSNHDRYQIEAEAKPEMLGYSRLQIRVRTDFEGPPNPALQMIHVALRVPERPDIQVTIKDAPGAVMNNLNKHQLAIALSQDWTEVLFDLLGPEDERVLVEIYFPEAEAETKSAIPEAHFRAVGALPDALQEAEPLTASTSSPVPIPQNSTWQDSFEDENIRTVFIHLQRHGSVTEHELTQFLGGARKARSFSLAFEEYLKKVPFSVRIETTASGKRYVKET